ncbi:hypothetical protein RI129_001613 [Pyrocoelia pectoralis]|uniref:COMM domain-containing protein n=1 Tax=Pyrocoelia pectoralis TaxID=417401 RepID=A0AAN7VYU9_9COLE
MNISWITITSKLQAGIDVINSVEVNEFSTLLQQIKRYNSDNTFTQPELETMQESLGLNSTKLELLIQTVFYIFKQSLKVILKPTTLQKQLVETLNFRRDKAEAFVKAWTIQTKIDFENLEDRYKLHQISWELNLQTSSPIESREAVPNLRLKLGLTKSDMPQTKNLTLELDKKGLLQIYNTFENIQNKIDFLR